MKKLPDILAACNLIKRIKKYGREHQKSKSLLIPFIIDEFKLYVHIGIIYNNKTHNVNCGHGIRFKKIIIYPTTNQKLKCTNKHALDYLEKERLYSRECHKNIRNNKRK